MDEQTTEQIDSNDNAITLGDVVLMHNIIATVSRRGGFEAEEFQIVGKLFEKLKMYIPAKEENVEEASSGAETTNTSTEQCEADQMTFNFAQGETVTQ